MSKVVSAAVSTYTGQYNKEKHVTCLIIDDSNTDWTPYFRGKKVLTDWDIRLEVAAFQEINLVSSSSGGTLVTIKEEKPGAGQQRTPRSFKPDILLIRQNLKNASEDYKNILLGFQYGGVPGVNSLSSIYNFQDKPWVYAHLREIQRRVGEDKFPLIQQQYFPDHRDMLRAPRAGSYPCVLKVGHAHGGLGKVKVETESAYQDIASVVAVSGQYVTVENYVEAKHDLHIFKIGDFYRAITCSHCCDCRRPSVSGQWRSVQTVVEEVPVLDRYKLWIDKVSEMFGGLTVCSLEAVVGKDDSEHIIEVNDSAMNLLGDTVEEDRQMIADLVIAKLEECLQSNKLNGFKKEEEEETTSLAASEELGEKQKRNICRTDSRVSSVSGSGVSVTSEASSVTKRNDPDSSSGDTDETIEDTNNKPGLGMDGEDTMKNLRTSFAGLFGSDLK